MALNEVRAQNTGPYDTLLVNAIEVQGERFPMIYIREITIMATYIDPKKRDEMRRLRYNVNKVYPYAVTAAYILDKVDNETAARSKKRDRKEYLKALEKEMNERFKNELKDLSITQGQILVKLINRQTGRNCYSVIKDIKGGFNARMAQTTAFFFDNDLKARYDPFGKDRDIELIVEEIEARNYYQYQVQKMQGAIKK